MHTSNIDTIRNRLNDLDGLVDDDPDDYPDDESYDGAGAGYGDDDGDDDYGDDEYDDDYGELIWPANRRWRTIVAFLGAVLGVGAVATAVIINSGDNASTKATVGPAPRPVTSVPRATNQPSTLPSREPSASPEPPPETFTTVTTPTPEPAPMPADTPTDSPTAASPPTVLPPPPTLDPRTVIYSVSGTKRLLDLVNVVYTDAQGYPKTDFNVSLPWSKVIVLNPGVRIRSVIATSLYARLNCSIRDASGQPVVVSARNSSLATCTR